jgi:hypothetical protein
VVTGEFRIGDVRHVVASPALAGADLGFLAQTAFSSGMAQFAHARLREPAGGSQLGPSAEVNRRPLVSVSDPQSRR